MLHIGFHESSSNGYLAMGNQALGVGADTFAFFTRNPRGGSAKPIDPRDAQAFCALAHEHNFAPLVAHAPYTMNPCSADPHLRDFAKQMMQDDLTRLEYTPNCFYNFHPGSHVQQGAAVGIELTARMLSDVFTQTKDLTGGTIVLIETMAGKGSEIGRTFGEVKDIIDQAEAFYGAPLNDKLGVCIDTCHLWDGGYDIVNDLDGVIAEFDRIIGLTRLKAVHLNDSMNDRDTHKDRHQKIGMGKIGVDALARVINHDSLCALPFILETPNEIDGYKAEIALLKERFLQ